MTREVEARLKLSAVDRTAKAFNAVQGKLAAVERQTSAYNRTQMAVSKATRQAEASMLAYGRAMGAVAVGGGLVGALRTTADFETRLTGIQKKLGGTAEDVAKLGDEAKALAASGDLAVPLEEILSAYERGAAAGLPLSELREFATLSAKAADAFEMSAEDVGNAAAGFRVSMNIPISEMERYFDLINGLADSGISDERDIVDFLDRSGATLKTFGLANEEIAALGSTLLNLKIPAEVGARAMNTLATKLLVPMATKKSKGAFDELYGGADKFTKLLKKDARGALVDFLKRIRELDKFKQAEILTDILGQGFADEVQRLSVGMDELTRNLDYMDSKDWFGSLDKSYKMKLDDFWSQWQIFKSQVGELTIDVGLKGLPAVKAGLADIQNMLRTHETLWEAYQKGRINLLNGLGLGMSPDDVKDLQTEKANIEAHRQYSASRAAAPDLPNIADESLNTNIKPGKHLPDGIRVPGWRPGAGADETFEQSYRRQNNEILAAEAARRERAALVGAHQVYREEAARRPVQPTGDANYDAFAAAAAQPRPVDNAPYGIDRFLWGDAAEPGFNAKDHFRVETGISGKEASSVDPDALRQAMESGPDPDSLRQAIEGGGEAAGTSIRDAAYEVNKAGGEAGSAFASMIAGIGAQIGRDAAASFNANVRIPLPNGASTTTRPPERNLGVSMPNAGTPGGSP